MKINWLEVEGFRGYKESDRFEFGAYTEISGENGQGKSSIGDAITYAIAGTALDGKANATDRLMNNQSSELRVAIGIEVDGQQHEIERQAFKSKSKTEGKIIVDRVPSSQDQIDSIIGNRKHFLATFLLDYFCMLDQKDARAELMGMLPIPREEEVKACLPEYEQVVLKDVKLNDPDFFITKEKAALKQYQDELKKLDGAEEEIKASLNIEIPDEIMIDTTELETVREGIRAIESAKPKLIDVLPLQQKRQALLHEYQVLQKGLKFDEHIIECDNCGHRINLNAEQDKCNEEITLQMATVMEQGKSAAAELEKATVANQETLNAFQSANAETLAVLKEEQRTLETNLRQVEQHNMRAQLIQEQVDKAKSRAQQVEDDKVKLSNAVDETTAKIKAAQAYNVKKCEIQVAQIESILHRVSIRLFDIVKSTGEIKPVFKLDYDGKEYRTLSTSEKIRCGLEISKLIRTLTGKQYPVFIDCAESITHFDKPESQTIVARVVKGQPLQIEKEVNGYEQAAS